VQPSANDIVRYRRGLKDKKLTGPLDTSGKNPLQRFAAGTGTTPAGGARH